MNSRLAPIRRFLRPPLYIPIGVTLLLGAGYFAKLMTGTDVTLLIMTLVGIIAISYSWVLWSRKLKWSEKTLRSACRNYGVDALAEDFRLADAIADGLKLGQRFLFSRHAVEILALEKITDVRVQSIDTDDGAKSHIVCTAQGLSVTVAITGNTGQEIADLIRKRCGNIQQQQTP